MKSKIMQGFAVILFATTAITCFGVSQEETDLIECNNTLDKIQEMESSRWYKIEQLLAHPGSSACWGSISGLVSLFFGCPALSGLLAMTGFHIWEKKLRLGVIQDIENVEYIKKDTIRKKADIEKRMESTKNK